VSRLVSLTTDEGTQRPPSNLRRQSQGPVTASSRHDNSASVDTRQAETVPSRSIRSTAFFDGNFRNLLRIEQLAPRAHSVPCSRIYLILPPELCLHSKEER